VAGHLLLKGMKTIIVYIIFLLLFFTSLVSFGQIDSLNAIRKRHGLPELQNSLKLQISAKAWLVHLDRNDRGMVHDFDTKYGEVLTNSVNPLAWWMGSPSHRKVLLGRWKRIGIAYRNGVYCARLE
jgi:uncharacterized protein YkwD